LLEAKGILELSNVVVVHAVPGAPSGCVIVVAMSARRAVDELFSELEIDATGESGVWVLLGPEASKLVRVASGQSSAG
jgi:hypothetical protein